MDDEPSWQRQLLVGLSALLAIGVLVGGIFAVVAVRAADYLGLGDGSRSSTPGSLLPTTGAAPKTKPTPAIQPSTPTTQTSPSPSTHRPGHAITLTVSPHSAGSFQKVNLTGTYPGHDGTRLQVQRSVGNGPWSDFPTSTTVTSGRFATYIQTAMVGANHFRMLDKATGKTSNTVNVTIG